MKCRIDTKGGDWLQQDNVEVIEFRMKPVLERYYNEDTSWGVFNFTTEDDIPEYNEYIDFQKAIRSKLRELSFYSQYSDPLDWGIHAYLEVSQSKIIY